MEKHKIKSYIKQIRGVSYKPDDLCDVLDDSSVILLRANNIEDGIINFDGIQYVSKSRVSSEQYLKKGDILICASSGSKNLVGKAASFDFDIECTFGAFCKVIRPKDGYSQYLSIFFQSQSYRKKISRFAIGANINNIRNEHIDELYISMYPESERLFIVKKINTVQSIVFWRKNMIKKLDELIKARFVEMFGDPQINYFGWDIVNISEIIGGKVSNGFFAKRDDYVEDGNVGVIGVSNIVNRMYSKVDELPRTNASDNEIEKFEVKYGDILFCRSSLVAEGIGKASIIPEDVKKNILFECHVIRLPLDLSKCVPEFIQVLSTTDYFRNQIIAQSKTATMTTIGQDGILKTNIILPPMARQIMFYNFILQVNKSKVEVQKALDEAQLLFDSLMQKYFG